MKLLPLIWGTLPNLGRRNWNAGNIIWGVKLSNRHFIIQQQLYQHYNFIKDNVLKIEM